MTSIITVKTCMGWQYVRGLPIVGGVPCLAFCDDYRLARSGDRIDAYRHTFPQHRFELKHIEEVGR